MNFAVCQNYEICSNWLTYLIDFLVGANLVAIFIVNIQGYLWWRNVKATKTTWNENRREETKHTNKRRANKRKETTRPEKNRTSKKRKKKKEKTRQERKDEKRTENKIKKQRKIK